MEVDSVFTAVLGPLGALAFASVAYWMERKAHVETRKECAEERKALTANLGAMDKTLSGFAEIIRAKH